MTVVVVLDPFNKYPIGYATGYQESPELIKAALRNATNHTAELFGQRLRPVQIQSDNYQIKIMLPTYGMAEYVTPAEVGNAKAKPIEPYFRRLNHKYAKKMLWQLERLRHNLTQGEPAQYGMAQRAQGTDTRRVRGKGADRMDHRIGTRRQARGICGRIQPHTRRPTSADAD